MSSDILIFIETIKFLCCYVSCTVGSVAEAMSSASSAGHYVWTMAASHALPASAERNLKVHGAV